MRAAENSSFQPFSSANLANFDRGVARSGVNGPLMVGSRSERFCGKLSQQYRECRKEDYLTISMTSSYSAPSSALKKPFDAASSAAAATADRPVALR